MCDPHLEMAEHRWKQVQSYMVWYRIRIWEQLFLGLWCMLGFCLLHYDSRRLSHLISAGLLCLAVLFGLMALWSYARYANYRELKRTYKGMVDQDLLRLQGQDWEN